MTYKVIFTLGYLDDDEAEYKGARGDVLIIDENGLFYNPYFTTLESISVGFSSERPCYIWDKLVIVHKLTKENILQSIPELNNWLFQKRWKPLTKEEVEKYYYPQEDWVYYEVVV
jgi:hypothetical protein